MDTINASVGKLMSRAFLAAFLAFIFGLSSGHTLIKNLDMVFFPAIVLSGLLFMFVLFQTRHALRRLADVKHTASDAASKSAHQFLWSCVFFSMLSVTFGVSTSSVIWRSADWFQTFIAVWFGALTCVGIYPVRRDAKGFLASG